MANPLIKTKKEIISQFSINAKKLLFLKKNPDRLQNFKNGKYKENRPICCK